MVAAHAMATENQCGSGDAWGCIMWTMREKYTSGWWYGKRNRGEDDPPCSCGETSPVMWIFDIPRDANTTSLNGVTNQIQLGFFNHA